MREQLIRENKEIISNEGNNAVFGRKMRMNYFKLKKLIKDLEYENETYSIIIPKDIDSFVKEGKDLCHAVGTSSYISKVFTDQLTILFCRKKRDLEKSFYTIAIKDGEIVMVKGFQNKEVSHYANSESLYSFIKEWATLNSLNYNK